MILKKKALQTYLDNMRLVIPNSLFKELLEKFGHIVTDEAGHAFEYTEEDIYEQLRKIIQNHISKEKILTDR